MIKTIPLFMQTLAVISLLISCGPSPSGDKIKALDDVSPDNQEVLFWYQAGEEEEAVVEQIIQDFNLTNEYGIRIDGQNRGFYEDLWKAVSEAESGPDILWIVAGENKERPWRKELTDLFPYLLHPRWGGKKDIPASMLEKIEDSVNGYLFRDSEFGWILPGLPVLHDPSLIFCNMDRLKELGSEGFPLNKEEFRNICEAAAMLKDVGGLIYPPDSETLLAAAYADGWNPVDKKGVPNEDADALFSSGNFLFTLQRAGASYPAIKKFSGQMEFSGGQFIFSMDSASGAGYYGDSIEASMNPFNWSIHPFPSSGTEKFTGSWDRIGAIISPSGEKRLACWIFMKWTLSGDIQKKLADASGLIPVNPEALDILLEESEADSVYGRVLEIAKNNVLRPFPWHGESSIFYNLVTAEFRNRLDMDIKADN